MERNFVWQYTEFCKFIVSPAAIRCILVTGKFVKLCLQMYLFEDGHLFTIMSAMSNKLILKTFRKDMVLLLHWVLGVNLKYFFVSECI